MTLFKKVCIWWQKPSFNPFHPRSSGLAILQPPHKIKEESDDQGGATEQHNTIPQPTTPSRLQCQLPLYQGWVAYVIYGGQGSEAGVYYNWYTISIFSSCQHSLSLTGRHVMPWFDATTATPHHHIWDLILKNMPRCRLQLFRLADDFLQDFSPQLHSDLSMVHLYQVRNLRSH